MIPLFKTKSEINKAPDFLGGFSFFSFFLEVIAKVIEDF